MAEAEAATGEEKLKPNRKKLIIIIILVLVVLLVVGGGATFWLLSGDSAEEENTVAAVPEVVLSPTMLYYSLQPTFVMSYMVQGRQRYVQLGLDIATHNPKVIEAMQTHDPLIRSEVLRIVGEHPYAQLRTGVGKLELLQQLQNRFNNILQQEAQITTGVDAVLVNNFVMQ